MVARGERKWLGWLWAVAIIAVAPVLAFAGVVTHLHLQAHHRSAVSGHARIATTLAAAVDDELRAELGALWLLANSTSLDPKAPGGFHRAMTVAVETHRNWATMGLMSVDGRRMVMSSTQPYPGELPPPIDPDSIRAAAERVAPVIGAVIPGGFYVDRPLVLLRVPVIREGEVAFVLSATVKLEAIAAVAKRQGVPPGSWIAFHDRTGAQALRLGPSLLPGDIANVAEAMAPFSQWRLKVGRAAALDRAETAKTVAPVLGGGAAAVLLSLLGTLWLGRRFRDRILAEEGHRGAALQHALDEARRAQMAARAADDAKSRFLAAASHDLRQPFQALTLYHQVLDQMVSGPPRARTALEGLRQAVAAGDELLRSLLDVSAIEAGTVRPRIDAFPVMEVVEEVAAEYGELAARRGLRFHVRGAAARVESDRVLLKRIVRNLLHNAFRYTEKGGIVVGCRRRGERVLIQVWDTGPGIAADQLEMIFEDFYQVGNQARDRGKGLGLGLSVVRRMAGLLCHELTVQSRRGRGSVFSIAVPLAQAEAAPARCAPELQGA